MSQEHVLRRSPLLDVVTSIVMLVVIGATVWGFFEWLKPLIRDSINANHEIMKSNQVMLQSMVKHSERMTTINGNIYKAYLEQNLLMKDIDHRLTEIHEAVVKPKPPEEE